MNAFLVGADDQGRPCPYESPRQTDDQRINKMFLETCQVLNTALILNDAPEEVLLRTKAGKPYRLAHPHHPLCKWAAESQGNWLWLFQMGTEYAREIRRRYGRTHSCEKTLRDLPQHAHQYIPAGGLTPWVLCMPEEFQDHTDPVGSYRRFYMTKPNVRWVRTSPPSWWVDRGEEA